MSGPAPAAGFRKSSEALVAQLHFVFYSAFELLVPLPGKLQEQATALTAWAKRQRSKPTKANEKPKLIHAVLTRQARH